MDQKGPKWTKSEYVNFDWVVKLPQPVDADHGCPILSKWVVSVCSAGDRQPVGGAASSHLGEELEADVKYDTSLKWSTFG